MNKIVHISGTRKTAVARATIKQGNGIVKIDKCLLDNYKPELAKIRIQEPLILAEKLIDKIDINISVKGGGFMAQANAIRTAIARALVEYTKSDALKKTYLDYDRQLLVADVRRKEMRKPNDSKARAKRQKSYR
ncbi:MAG: 30S ribosomal protein S9 [Candidatus Woesearchaeota archaeon]